MKRSITRWTTAVAAAAVLAMPATGWAQTGATAQQPPATSSAQQDTQSQSGTPQEHLAKAKTSLDAIEASKLTGRTKTQVAELKKHLNALERVAGAGDKASPASGAQRSAPATAARSGAKWSTEVAAIDKILAGLLDANAGATGTTGTTGTTGSASAAVTLDEQTRASLTDVRQHVTSFAAAMSGTQAAPDTPPSSTAGTASAAGSTTGSTTSATGSTTGTTGSTTGTTGSMTGSTAGTTGATAAPGSAAQAPVDPDAARRHLTEARNTLSELTQLPAAAQLSGEARTQVSQLIANFNELITAQANWRASYTKLEANLEALIGPDDPTQTGAATATGATTATGTTGTTGSTTGTAGTSGTASATTSLDPTIKAKLVELRAKLNEFERAAGGDAATSGAAATTGTAATGSMTGTTGSMTGTTGSTTGSTTSTTGTSAATGTTAEQQRPQNPEAGAPATEAQGHSEAMRHLQAIEAILGVSSSASGSTAGTAGTTGSTTGSATSGSATGASLTLDRAKLDQLRTHLTELRRLLNQADRK